MSDISYNPHKKQLIHDEPKPQAQPRFEYKDQDHPNSSLKSENDTNVEYDPLKDIPTERQPQRGDTISINNQKVYKFCPHCGESLQS